MQKKDIFYCITSKGCILNVFIFYIFRFLFNFSGIFSFFLYVFLLLFQF